MLNFGREKFVFLMCFRHYFNVDVDL